MTYAGTYGATYPGGLSLTEQTVTATVHESDGTFVADLPRLVAWRWTDQVAPLGGGEVVVPADDPRVDEATDGRLVVLRVDGVIATGFRIDPPSRRDLLQPAGTITLAGRHVLSLLDDAVVYPERGAGRLEPQSRPLNWSSRDWVEWTGGAVWSTPQTHGTQASPDNPEWEGSPEAWPAIADHAEWMWAGASLGGAPAYIYDPFDAYFRRTLTLGADEDVIIAATADDEIRVLVDGQQVISTQGPAQWRRTFVWRGRLGSGDHQIAVRGRNIERFTGTHAPASAAGVLLAVGRHDADGEMTAVFGVSQGTDWLAAGDLAAPPGMTPGRSIGVLLDEGIARGCLTGVDRDFNDEEASPRPGQALGEVWLQDEDRVVDCGRSLLDVVTAIASSTVDVGMSLIASGRDVVPTVRLWGHDRRFQDRSTGDAPLVLRRGRDLTSMFAERPGVKRTALLVDTPDGWTESAVAGTRREALLRLGEHEQPESAATQIAAELAAVSTVVPVATAVFADGAQVKPYAKLEPGDLILAPGYDDPDVDVAWRVLSVSCAGGARRPMAWTVELGETL